MAPDPDYRWVRIPSWRDVFGMQQRQPSFWGFDLTWITPGGPTVVAFWAVAFVFTAFFVAGLRGVTFGQGVLVRLLLLPLGAGWVMSRRMADGCSIVSHARTRAWAVLSAAFAAPAHAWRGAPVTPVTWDATSPHVLSGRVCGPARVTINRPVALRHTRRGVEARPDDRGKPAVVVVCSSHDELRVCA